MKKVVILAYFFTPNSLTASNRPLKWAQLLGKYGYYSIVITRTWGDGKINKPSDVFIKGHDELFSIDKCEGYEIHRVTYQRNLRDRCFVSAKMSFLSKFLTLVSLVSNNWFNVLAEGKEIYNYSRKLLKREGIDKLIITANPFIMFKYGYLLKKEFDLSWIADYRDDWGTSELTEKSNGLFKIISKLENLFEKKWVGTASIITSVSKYYAEKISRFVSVDGGVLLNGFEEYIKTDFRPDKNVFQLTYNGSLYNTQPVEILIQGVIDFIDSVPDVKIQINFPGLLYSSDQSERVNRLIKGYECYFHLSKRIPKEEVLKIQASSHLLVMITHEGIKGVPSSKLYEYLSMKRQIMVVNGDDDIVNETVLNSRIGVIAPNCESVKNELSNYYSMFLNDSGVFEIQNTESSRYKVDNSVKELSQILDRL